MRKHLVGAGGKGRIAYDSGNQLIKEFTRRLQLSKGESEPNKLKFENNGFLKELESSLEIVKQQDIKSLNSGSCLLK